MMTCVDFNPDLFETKQVFYASKDGPKIPMFIIHKKVSRTHGMKTVILVKPNL